MYPRSPPLLPATADAILAARRIEVIADGICDAAVLTFFERQRDAGRAPHGSRGSAARSTAASPSRSRHAVADGASRSGDAFGLADIAAGCALGYLAVRFPEEDWRAEHPGLLAGARAYAERLFERPSFSRRPSRRRPQADPSRCGGLTGPRPRSYPS